MVRTCAHCKEPMPQRDDEPGPKYAKRVNCSRICMYAARRGQVPPNKGLNRAINGPPSERRCPACDAQLVARESESVDQFAMRTFCDRVCARKKTRFQMMQLPERF